MNAHSSSRPDVTLRPGGDATLWTEQRIRALGAVTDLPTAGRIFGLGRSLAYQLAKADQFPAPVIRVGARYRVPVAGILTALAIPTTDDLTPASKGSVDHPDAIRSTEPPLTAPVRRQGEP